MGSCRIDIENQMGGRKPQPLRVEPQMPAAMTGHMSAQQWESFQSKVNQELEPLNGLKKYLFFGRFAAWGVIVITFIGGFAYGIRKNMSDPGESDHSPLDPVSLMMPCISAVLIACLVWLHYRFMKQLQEKLKAVCGRISQESNGMTFHARNDHWNTTQGWALSIGKNYIEVSIDGGAAGGPVVAPENVNVVITATVVSNSAV